MSQAHLPTHVGIPRCILGIQVWSYVSGANVHEYQTRTLICKLAAETEVALAIALLGSRQKVSRTPRLKQFGRLVRTLLRYALRMWPCLEAYDILLADFGLALCP